MFNVYLTASLTSNVLELMMTQQLIQNLKSNSNLIVISVTFVLIDYKRLKTSDLSNQSLK
jgi:hypothetical protein